MALKFLNKKGWHTGSLRNIENVWKAEQKHDAEQKKLEELRKQIHEERERSEFRQLQEQAGLVPKQERLEFLYDSGLAVGKGGSSFKTLESLPRTDPDTTASSSSAASTKQPSSAPGALFEEKPQSANDTWRKLHSDPLLLIRQREQEALARVKNNPIQMAMIRKSVEEKKPKEKNNIKKDEKKGRKKHHHKKSKHRKHSSSESGSDSEDFTLPVDKRRDASHHKGSKYDKPSHKAVRNSDEESTEGEVYRKKNYHQEEKERRPAGYRDLKTGKNEGQHRSKRTFDDSQRKEYSSDRQVESRHDRRSNFDSSDMVPRNESNNRRRNPAKLSEEERAARRSNFDSSDMVPRNESNNRRKEYSSDRQVESRHDRRSNFDSSDMVPRNESNNRRRNPAKLSEEERAARLREMEMDAVQHEEQRWKRIKKAEVNDAREAIHDSASLGRNFLDAAQKTVYGAEKGGSSTIEESVRRRTHYLQGRSESEGNAFRR
ncbi:CBF1-interacting co-repressor CIR [Forsythia ovata]|uniref:CBF1-interacting co-repressor CIR n=1 Tax=Forsythia ovata TaxID=205694 RepID=A0ABD1S674_9LAMI